MQSVFFALSSFATNDDVISYADPMQIQVDLVWDLVVLQKQCGDHSQLPANHLSCLVAQTMRFLFSISIIHPILGAIVARVLGQVLLNMQLAKSPN